MIKKVLALICCSIGILLPYRLRIFYVEGLGWLTQFLYASYIGVMKVILGELEKAKERAS